MPITASSGLLGAADFVVQDPTFAKISALLHCDGTNGATAFTDSGPLADNWTGTNCSISTAQQEFGSGSAVFNGTSSFMQPSANAGFAFGTGSFTIEMWIRLTSATGTTQGLYADIKQGGFAPLTWRVSTTGKLQFTADAFGHSMSTAASISSTTWTHIAVTFDGTTFRQFIDGTLDATTLAAAVGSNITNTQPVIGVEQNADWLAGNADDIRIKKGTAQYTASFTRPSSPFPNS